MQSEIFTLLKNILSWHSILGIASTEELDVLCSLTICLWVKYIEMNENDLSYLKSCVTLRPQWDSCHRGEAEVRILNFKTTWSEIQKASQTATERRLYLAGKF